MAGGLRKQIRNEWPLNLDGVLLIVLGIIVAVQPNAGGLAVAWTIGMCALLFGVTLVLLAFRSSGLG